MKNHIILQIAKEMPFSQMAKKGNDVGEGLLSCISNWTDIDIMFGIKSLALREILWQAMKYFIEEHGNHMKQLKSELIQEGAVIYAERLKGKGDLLEKCEGLY